MSEEERALTIQEASSVAQMGGSMAQMLANMSDEEFETRLTALKRSQERMRAIQINLMQENVDYGKIPGTGDKPTLLKAGSETLLQFYQLVPTFDTTLERGDGITSPHIRYHVKCQLHLGTSDGPVVGWGEGSANSSERKYRYRTAQRACPKCGALSTIKKSKFKPEWYCYDKAGGCGATFAENDPQIVNQQRGMVENPDPDDMDNTLLKMAEKRAQIDATLRATATSGLFTQDVEDMDFGSAPAPAETNGHGDKPAPSPPPAQSNQAESKAENAPPKGGTGLITEAQLKAIFAIGKSKKYTEDQIKDGVQGLYGKEIKYLTKKEASEYIDLLQSDQAQSQQEKLV
jgi:hypothetical protein